MLLQQQIESKIKTVLKPVFLEVINESFMHNVPTDSESHFKVVIVSEQFQGKSLLERHRMVNEVLAKELEKTIHALSMQTFTPEEWEKKGGKVFGTPPCLGGSKN